MDPFLGYLLRVNTDTQFTYYSGDGLARYDDSFNFEPHDYDVFDVNIHDYEHNGTMTVALYDGDERIQSGDYLLAAFDESGECVGHTESMAFPFDGGSTIFPLMVYGNEDGIGLTFKAYQLSTGEYHDVDQRLSFTHDMTLGDGFDPVVMNLVAEPTEFSIGNPYPNPFNPVVNFDVEITNESYVTAKIYNISGQEIATIHEGMLSAKNHQMRWIADSYASGVYFIKVVIDNNPATHRKIVLLK